MVSVRLPLAFCVAQFLIEKDLFKQIDILSTVSGGGYSGSCLSALMARGHDGEKLLIQRNGPEEPPALNYTRSWATNSSNARIRLKAELDRAKQKLALLREEVRIENARMARLHPQRRPHYSPTERLAILEPSAARRWTGEQTAGVFQITAPTVTNTVHVRRAEGRTPNEGYRGRRAANQRPRIEPRQRWPHGSPSAKPWALVAGKPGAHFTIYVDFQDGRRHLPIVSLKRVA